MKELIDCLVLDENTSKIILDLCRQCPGTPIIDFSCVPLFGPNVVLVRIGVRDRNTVAEIGSTDVHRAVGTSITKPTLYIIEDQEDYNYFIDKVKLELL